MLISDKVGMTHFSLSACALRCFKVFRIFPFYTSLLYKAYVYALTIYSGRVEFPS
jgi:hypothetical protein